PRALLGRDRPAGLRARAPGSAGGRAVGPAGKWYRLANERTGVAAARHRADRRRDQHGDRRGAVARPPGRRLAADAALLRLGAADGPTPAFCVARTGVFEIEVGGRKLVGSAHRRQGESFLQHGAVLLAVDEPRVRALFPTTRDPLATLTTLEAALGRRPSFEAV